MSANRGRAERALLGESQSRIVGELVVVEPVPTQGHLTITILQEIRRVQIIVTVPRCGPPTKDRLALPVAPKGFDAEGLDSKEISQAETTVETEHLLVLVDLAAGGDTPHLLRVKRELEQVERVIGWTGRFEPDEFRSIGIPPDEARIGRSDATVDVDGVDHRSRKGCII